ncbi:type II secretion system F family protein [Agaribacterium haliotis]|uniref:type II secretion system F family protein n=1 Tax=Agaribacterium haliotis TaxID=2013869 RepID=UPI000BB573F9|nr:type II secretion system F family protein [Agaribacterium haliotis]
MAQFQYQGRTNRGQSVQGRMEASSIDTVAAQLVGRGITPIKIDEVSKGASLLRQVNDFIGANKVRPVDLIMFCRQMFTITKAGIPLTRGIRGLAASLRHEYFQEVLNEVADRLEAGSSLSVAMRHYPKVFDQLFVSMIAVGESSGKLDEVFRQIGFYIERDEETKKRIKSAMRYPSFVLIAISAAIVILNIFVIPEFAKLFSRFGAELPLLTRILIGTSNLFVHYGHFIALGAAALVGGTIYYLKSEPGALMWGRYKMRMPIVGSLIERASMARYARSFSLMLGAGVPISQALGLCAAAIDNPWLEQKIQGIREGIERGDSLLRTHLQAALFTPLVLQMISVGEESGQVESLLTEVAEFYEREVDYDLKTLTDKIEPLLITVMAGFVLVMALGIFLPMWSLYEVQTGK